MFITFSSCTRNYFYKFNLTIILDYKVMFALSVGVDLRGGCIRYTPPSPLR